MNYKNNFYKHYKNNHINYTIMSFILFRILLLFYNKNVTITTLKCGKIWVRLKKIIAYKNLNVQKKTIKLTKIQA